MSVTKDNIISISELKLFLLDSLYPVGTIYMTVDSRNPNEILGGGSG